MEFGYFLPGCGRKLPGSVVGWGPDSWSAGEINDRWVRLEGLPPERPSLELTDIPRATWRLTLSRLPPRGRGGRAQHQCTPGKG